MGWFIGHLFPALCWTLFGCFFYLQSCTFFVWTEKYRSDPFWLQFKNYGFIAVGLVGGIGEMIGQYLILNNFDWIFNDNIRAHIIIYFSMALMSGLEILHIRNILLGPIWSLLPIVGVAFGSIMFMFHQQHLIYWRYLHLVAG
jgi:hypothetical protein